MSIQEIVLGFIDVETIKQKMNNAPYLKHLGIKIIELKDGKSIAKMFVDKKFFHAGGALHGGAVFSLADTAGAAALFSLVGYKDTAATVEMKLNYVNSVRDECELIAKAKIVHLGKRFAVAIVKVKDDSEKLIAKGLGTYVI